METKKCLECDSVFFGRADKKFCSDHCRNAYNNKRHAEEEAIIKKVNRILRRNRQILHLFSPHEKATIPLRRLLSEGFDLTHFTGNYLTRDGREYRFCYDLGYLQLSDEMVLIVRREEKLA